MYRYNTILVYALLLREQPVCDITKETRGSQVASVVPTVSCNKKEVSQEKKKKDSIFILIFKMTLITLLDVCNEVPVSFSVFFF